MCGSNWPFRGAKNSNWEGGTRTPAFVNGGLLPNTQRGKVLNDMIHIVDWYATFLVLAGLDPTDPSSTSPSPIDSINVWPFVNGTVSVSPRQVIVYDNNKLPVGSYPNAQFNVNLPGAAAIGAQGGIRSGKYKLLIGPQVYSAWYGGPLNNYFSEFQSLVTTRSFSFVLFLKFAARPLRQLQTPQCTRRCIIRTRPCGCLRMLCCHQVNPLTPFHETRARAHFHLL